MYLDKQNMFSEAQAVTSSAASTNVIDLGDTKDAGNSDLELYVKVGTAFATCTSVTISLQTDSADTMGSPTTLATSGAIVRASLTANTEIWKIRLPKGCERYVRLYYTVATPNATAGTFTAGLILDRQTNV